MSARWGFRALALFLLLAAGGTIAVAHPGSGIVADREGRVYFVDTRGGVMRIERDGSLERQADNGYHWLAIDVASRFAKAGSLSTQRGDIVHVGTQPTLILASDFPIVIGGDGALYYPEPERGALRIMRVDAAGHRSVRGTLPRGAGSDSVLWLNGLAAGPDGSLYYTQDRTVGKLDKEGHASTIATGFAVPACIEVPGVEAGSRPFLRGLAVAQDGTVFVAASGCGAVLKITPGGEIAPILRTASPWSPTAVAVAGGDIHVLEYLHTKSDNRKEWVPRVRTVSRDGKVKPVVTSP